MPAKPSPDPMVNLPFRVRRSFKERIEQEASERGLTVSDVIRLRLQEASLPLIHAPRPRKRRRRVESLVPCSQANPELIRRLARIEGRLQEVARLAHEGALLGHPVEAAEVLLILLSVQRQLQQAARAKAG